MNRNYGYKQQQSSSSSYSVREESHQQSSFAKRQNGWHSNSDLVSGLQVVPAACVESQLLKNQARLDGGFGAMHHDGFHRQNKYQSGGMHQTGWGHGSGGGVHKLIPSGTNGFNGSTQFSEAARFDNAMGNRFNSSSQFSDAMFDKTIGNRFNSSSQFSDAMFDNAMGNAEFETFEKVRVPAAGTVRMKETSYESSSSWGGGDEGGLNYQYCFDNGGANWNRNGGYQSFEWFSKGM